MKSLADALEILAGVLRDVASSPVPVSPEAAAVGLPDVSMKYARASTLAKMYDMCPRNMDYILARGVMAGKIRKLGGKNPDGTRGEVTTYHVADVEAYMIETRGGREA